LASGINHLEADIQEHVRQGNDSLSALDQVETLAREEADRLDGCQYTEIKDFIRKVVFFRKQLNSYVCANEEFVLLVRACGLSDYVKMYYLGELVWKSI
jgi:hypothetical protein